MVPEVCSASRVNNLLRTGFEGTIIIKIHELGRISFKRRMWSIIVNAKVKWIFGILSDKIHDVISNDISSITGVYPYLSILNHFCIVVTTTTSR